MPIGVQYVDSERLCDNCDTGQHAINITAGEFPNVHRLALCERCAGDVLKRLENLLRVKQ